MVLLKQFQLQMMYIECEFLLGINKVYIYLPCFTGELGQECDRAPAVCQKEQAKPSYLEQTARRNEEISKPEGEICTDSDHTDHYLIKFSSLHPEIALENETVDICPFIFNYVFFFFYIRRKQERNPR